MRGPKQLRGIQGCNSEAYKDVIVATSAAMAIHHSIFTLTLL